MKKKVLIIGGSSSLGIKVVEVFRKNKYEVISTFCNTTPPKDKKNLFNIKLDLSDNLSIRDFICDQTKDMKFDVVIFISGVLPGKSIKEYEFDEIDEVIATNFSGIAKFFKLIQNNLSKKSKVVFLTSVSAERGSYDPIYAASKGALVSFMKSIALWSKGNIYTNAVSPSLIEGSSMYNEMDSARVDFHKKNSPSGELIYIDDLANIIYDITKPNWQGLNGAVISVNGGSNV